MFITVETLLEKMTKDELNGVVRIGLQCMYLCEEREIDKLEERYKYLEEQFDLSYPEYEDMLMELSDLEDNNEDYSEKFDMTDEELKERVALMENTSEYKSYSYVINLYYKKREEFFERWSVTLWNDLMKASLGTYASDWEKQHYFKELKPINDNNESGY